MERNFTVVDLLTVNAWDPATARCPWLTPDLTVLDRADAVARERPRRACHRASAGR